MILEPEVHHDPRGYFFESFREDDFRRATGMDVHFVQDNESCSSRGVIRGLHFQRPPMCQAKLVRCVSGAVLDVAVDLRAGSPTYGRHVAVELTDANHRMLFVPHGFAHGFSVLSDRAVFQYKCDNYYSPAHEGGVALTDPSIAVDWRTPTQSAILSRRDGSLPLLADFVTPFTYPEK